MFNLNFHYKIITTYSYYKVISGFKFKNVLTFRTFGNIAIAQQLFVIDFQNLQIFSLKRVNCLNTIKNKI